MENKMSDKLIESINEIANLADSDKTNIKGKLYTTVDKRLQTFRKHFGRTNGCKPLENILVVMPMCRLR